MKFGLSLVQYKFLEDIIIKPLKSHHARVWIFGSRAKGTQQPFSDVDLMFELTQALPKGFIFEITSLLEESNFQYKLDLVNKDEVAKSYQADIEKSKIEL